MIMGYKTSALCFITTLAAIETSASLSHVGATSVLLQPRQDNFTTVDDFERVRRSSITYRLWRGVAVLILVRLRHRQTLNGLPVLENFSVHGLRYVEFDAHVESLLTF